MGSFDLSELTTRLNSEFAPSSEGDWRQSAKAALKGVDFDKALISTSDDGFAIQPVYGRASAAPARPRPVRDSGWTSMQRVEHPDLHEAGALVGADLEGGAGGIDLVFAASAHSLGAGVMVESTSDLAQVLRAAPLDEIALRIDAAHDTRHVAALLPALAEENGIDLATMRVQFALDPYGDLALRGRIIVPLDSLVKRIHDCARGLNAEGLSVISVMPDGRSWSAAGASEAQELGLVCATALTYLRGFEEAGMSLEEAVANVGFTLTADANQNLTIAKFRVLRVLWARIQEVLQVEAAPVHIHAETAWRMLTVHDPHVNILRGTIATFAAGVGGADSITVLPYSSALGLPDPLARRIARNTQTMLIEESNLHRVTDPAAGSGAIEALTDALAREAWALIGQIEEIGGIYEALRQGLVQDRVQTVREQRSEAYARRKKMITGTSAFADLNERPVQVMEAHGDDIGGSQLHLLLPEPGSGELFSALVSAARAGSTLADMARARGQKYLEIERHLRRARLSEPFERVRGVSEAAERRMGKRPEIFIAHVGEGASRSPRAGWTENLFAIAGLGAARGPETLDGEETARAFRQAGTPIACLCGSDEAYTQAAADIARALRKAGASEVFLAGKPGANREALEAAGIGRFVHAGCDVLEVLEHALVSATISGEDETGEA